MKVGYWLLTVAVAWWLRQGSAPPVPGKCEHRCGNVTVPFPFGLDANCARSPDFLLNCTNTKGPIQLQWGNLTIREISVGDSTMVVSLPEAYECYYQNGTLANKSNPLPIDLSPNPRCRFSETRNKLTVVGCNTMAVVANGKGMFGRGCISYCSGNVDFANKTTCSGQGCCQASIPERLKTLNININSTDQNVSASHGGGCARAFVVDSRLFNISNLTLPRFQDVGSTSGLALDWMVEPDVTCPEATKLKGPSYACGKNSYCKGFEDGSGYRCACERGYHGNPYSPFEGCIDINECEDPQKYPCHGKCKNTIGSYECHCPSGKKRNNKDRCQIPPRGIAIGAIAGSIFGMTVTASVSVTMRWRLRKINFRRNEGEHLKRCGVQIFTESELAKATDNYGDSNKLGDGSFGSAHKGTIAGDTVVVVKKPKDVDKSLLNENFKHELEILMKISHKYVVKLKGICLETRIPTLVYEYIPNGNLFRLIHQKESTISWEDRLRIATEVALALDYMHSSIETRIVHGNIKSANILLDQNCSVKISDFGTSVLISPKHRHIVATQKKDSLGYIDPEYLITGMLTNQSDVYSFGVVLVELLTRKELFVTESKESINVIHRFISLVTDNKFSDAVNFEGASEDEKERVGKVAEIAVKCLDRSGASRPAMGEVARQLAIIYPSSTAEEENEEAEGEEDAEKLARINQSSTVETSTPGEEGTSSCLSCLGMDSASSCI